MKLSEKLVHEHAIPGVKKLQNTVKLKGLDEFRTFFKKFIHSLFLLFWSKILISPKGVDLYLNYL